MDLRYSSKSTGAGIPALEFARQATHKIAVYVLRKVAIHEVKFQWNLLIHNGSKFYESLEVQFPYEVSYESASKYPLIGGFGKRIYHAKNVPSLLSATILAGNGIYHASKSIVWGDRLNRTDGI